MDARERKAPVILRVIPGLGLGGALAAIAALLAPSAAWAWQVADPIHHDCHERISAAALDQVRYVQAPPPLSAADASLRDGLQFDAGPYPANIYALSFIIGTRWPDSQGEPSFDFYKLSNVHNAPGDQASHCLREETDLGAETGDTHALAACRAAITTLYWQALATLDRRRARWIPTSARFSPNTSRSWARRRSRCPASTSSRGAPRTRSRTASRTPTGAWTAPMPATQSRPSSTGRHRCAAIWSRRRTATATRRSSTTARTTTPATPTACAGPPRRRRRC